MICSPDKLILGQLNIDSIRNKFASLKNTVGRKIDILLISETKLDGSFPLAQIKIYEFSAPFRFDGNSKGRRLLIQYVKIYSILPVISQIAMLHLD